MTSDVDVFSLKIYTERDGILRSTFGTMVGFGQKAVESDGWHPVYAMENFGLRRLSIRM